MSWAAPLPWLFYCSALFSRLRVLIGILVELSFLGAGAKQKVVKEQSLSTASKGEEEGILE